MNFCSECGSKVDVIADQAASSRSEVQREIKPVKSKKNIMLLIGFVVIFAILFGAYKFGGSKFSKEKQVNAMIEAFQKKDANAIDEFVKVDDPGLKMKADDIKGYIRYLKKSFL